MDVQICKYEGLLQGEIKMTARNFLPLSNYQHWCTHLLSGLKAEKEAWGAQNPKSRAFCPLVLLVFECQIFGN